MRATGKRPKVIKADRRLPVDLPDNTGRNQDGTFAPGQSGNPAGKPKGARHSATLAVEALLQGEADKITRKCIAMALNGDTTAMRLCLERIAPPAKGRAIRLDLPPVSTSNDVLKGQAAIAEAMAQGDITPDEAAMIANVLDTKRRTLETVEFEKRLAKIERALGSTK